MKYVADLVIVLILALFCVRSLRLPVANELTGAIGWFFAILAALGLSDPVGALFTKYLPSFDELSPYLSFLAIVLVLRLLLGMIGKAIPEEPKGLLNGMLKLVAAAFGFFKGAFFVSVVLLMVSTSPSVQNTVDDYTKSSIIYPHIKLFSYKVVDIITEYIPNVEALLQRLT